LRKAWESIEIKAASPYDSFDNIVTSLFESYIDRSEQRTVRAISQREGDLAIGALTAASVFSIPVVDIQFRSQVQFIIERLISEGAKSEGRELSNEQVESMAEDVLITAEKANQTTYNELVAAFAQARKESDAEDDDDGSALGSAARLVILIYLVRKVFGKRKKEAARAAESVVTGAYSYGAHTAATLEGKISKTWVSQKDEKVRSAHRILDGTTVAIDRPFYVNGVPIRFPGDPLAPIELIIQCRCYLKYGMSL
jgi:hypothetical protein